jgi:hypothetical protein
MENQNLFVLDTVDDDVLADRKAAQARTQVLIAPTPNPGMLRQQPETLCYGINQTAGNLGAAALAGT